MHWLETLKKEMLEITRTAALEYYPAINGYEEPHYNLRYEHVKQVEREALKLLEVYSDADKDIVLATVWTHDRFKPQFIGHDHGNRAADWVAENLESKGFPKEKVKAVEYAVRNHVGYDKNLLNIETLEAQLLWDADKLAHCGPSYFFQQFFIFSAKKICDRNEDLTFSPTLSIDNVLPALIREHSNLEINYSKPTPYHLEESWKIYIQKNEAVKVLIDAIQKQL